MPFNYLVFESLVYFYLFKSHCWFAVAICWWPYQTQSFLHSLECTPLWETKQWCWACFIPDSLNTHPQTNFLRLPADAHVGHSVFHERPLEAYIHKHPIYIPQSNNRWAGMELVRGHKISIQICAWSLWNLLRMTSSSMMRDTQLQLMVKMNMVSRGSGRSPWSRVSSASALYSALRDDPRAKHILTYPIIVLTSFMLEVLYINFKCTQLYKHSVQR